MNNRRRSDILVNTFHQSCLYDMTSDNRRNVSPERHAIIISDDSHDNEQHVRDDLKVIGVDPSTTIFFYDPLLAQSVTEYASNVLKKLLDLGYEHGFHFDTDSNRISTILNDIPGTRCIKIG